MADRHIYDEEGNVLDLSSDRGAPVLAAKIADFWARRGYRPPRIRFVNEPVPWPGKVRMMVCLRSDMRRGLPLQRRAL